MDIIKTRKSFGGVTGSDGSTASEAGDTTAGLQQSSDQLTDFAARVQQVVLVF